MTDQERLRRLEDRLWNAADQLRATSSLAASQYSTPVLGLIFLRYTDVRFTPVERELARPAGQAQVGFARARLEEQAGHPRGGAGRDRRSPRRRPPDSYDRMLFAPKSADLYQHVFTSYQGDGRSIYDVAA